MADVPTPDWAGIYAEHRDALQAVARSVIGAGADTRTPADIVGDVFEHLMANGVDPSSCRNPRAYLATAVRNQALDAAGRTRFIDDRNVAFDTEIGVHDIEESIDRARLGAAAAAALDELTDRERYVIEQRIMRDSPRPRSELAAELGVSGPRITQILGDAIARLRTLPTFRDLLPPPSRPRRTPPPPRRSHEQH